MNENENINILLTLWNKILESEDRDFTIVYKAIDTTFLKEDSKYVTKTTEQFVKERLGKYLSLGRCMMYLLWTYPNETFTNNDVHRCYNIFRMLVKFTSYIKMRSDDQINFGIDSYYPPGHYEIKRSKVLQDLFNSPEISILCFDVNNQEEGDNFTLLKLLHDENAFKSFAQSWKLLAQERIWDFNNQDNITELDVVIKRFDHSIEETKKLNDQMFKSINNISKSCMDFSGRLLEKVNLINKFKLEKQQEIIEEKSKIINQQREIIAQLEEICDTQNHKITEFDLANRQNQTIIELRELLKPQNKDNKIQD